MNRPIAARAFGLLCIAMFALACPALLGAAPAVRVQQPQPQAPKPTFADLKAKFETERSLTYSQRISTINQLGALESAEAAVFLYDEAQTETDVNVCRYLYQNCGRCKHPDLLDKLIAVAKIEDTAKASLASGAMQGLGYYGELAPLDLFESTMRGTNTLLVSAAVQAMSQASPPDLEERFRKALPEVGYYAGYQIVMKLAQLKVEDLPGLVEATIDSEEWKTAPDTYIGYLIRSLGQYNLTRAGLDVAAKYADDPRQNVSSAVAGLFVKITKPTMDVIDWLIEVGLEHDKMVVRQCAVSGLMNVTEPVDALPRIEAAIVRAARSVSEKDVAEQPLLLALLDALIRMKLVDDVLERVVDLADNKDDLIAITSTSALGFVQARPIPEDVLKALGKAVKSRRRPLLQGEALVSLGRLHQEEETLEHAEKLIDSRDWHVRAAVIEALRLLRSPKGIGMLIERLDEEEGRLRSDVTRALQSLTGKDLPDDYEVWARWWRVNEDGFVCVPESHEGKNAQALAGRTGAFYGHDIRTTRLIFVIDISGSMSTVSKFIPPDFPAGTSPNRLDVAKYELKRAISAFDDNVHFNMVFFDTTFELWQPGLVKASREVVTTALTRVDALAPRGGTNIFDSLEAALGDTDVDTIFLLTDGAPGSGRFINTTDICREILQLNRIRRIAINTVGIEVAGSSEQFLQQLAEENSGTYHAVR